MPIHLIYFESQKGELQLPPSSDTPCPPGFILREANYINQVRDLERRLEAQERRRNELAAERDQQTFDDKRRAIRRNIMTAIESSHTDQYTKDFLRLWCQLRDEKRDQYQASFRARELMLEGANFDRPRSADDILSGKTS